jgi:hypothetical protein
VDRQSVRSCHVPSSCARNAHRLSALAILRTATRPSFERRTKARLGELVEATDPDPRRDCILARAECGLRVLADTRRNRRRPQRADPRGCRSACGGVSVPSRADPARGVAVPPVAFLVCLAPKVGFRPIRVGRWRRYRRRATRVRCGLGPRAKRVAPANDAARRKGDRALGGTLRIDRRSHCTHCPRGSLGGCDHEDRRGKRRRRQQAALPPFRSLTGTPSRSARGARTSSASRRYVGAGVGSCIATLPNPEIQRFAALTGPSKDWRRREPALEPGQRVLRCKT